MEIKTTKTFEKEYRNLPEAVKKRVNKQFSFLIENPHHPSLRLKKLRSEEDVWEARLTKDYRFTFQMIGDTCILRRIGKHDVVLRNP